MMSFTILKTPGAEARQPSDAARAADALPDADGTGTRTLPRGPDKSRNRPPDQGPAGFSDCDAERPGADSA